MNIIINFSQLAISFSVLLVGISIIQFLLSNWIKNRLEKSIQHEYDKKLEDYKFLQLQKQKAEIIAKFFAKWIKYRGKEKDLLDKKELLDYYEELNQMSFEMTLWITDDNILKEIMSRLQNKDNAKGVRELVGEFRKLILGIKKNKFDINEITLWPTNKIAKELKLID